jgi:hypothetical protein
MRQARTLEKLGFKGEILGYANNYELVINGKKYSINFKTLSDCRTSFYSYVNRKIKYNHIN